MAAVTTQPSRVILRDQLDMQPLEKASNVEEVNAAVTELVRKMTARNHSLYFVELSDLARITSTHPVIKSCKQTAIQEAFTALQKTHTRLPSDGDIKPGANWVYVQG